jgi:hypothetical protein
LAEVVVKGSPVSTILPNEAVYGLVADGEEAVPFETASDLLRAPVFLEAGGDELPVGSGELGVPTGASPSPPSEIIGGARAVSPVLPGVAAHFTADGAGVPAQGSSDVGLREALFAKSGEFIPLS